MARTAQKEKAPWHKQSWEMWPVGLRYAALALMLGSFGALCFASWQLTRAAGFANAMQEVAHVFSGVSVLWNALATVVSGLVLALKQIHPAILLGCLTSLAIGWSACVALGTAFVRFTLVRK
jgi:ABC-type amino acid transport system permease subunit